ncbi:MBOAT family O-acyltransferase [Desulfogranum mediterraneum]|uniref:MBOAT family O-acyltransferase n=1 Tax=Desulfogranum mediterraneum TaxID=160661 RepID=UPI0003F7B127|nr:MBOAT family O-acyltransferase [Desulfogranum mediterraneum]
MVFNSLTFLLFFALVLALHHLPLSWTWKKGQLLLASYLFYAAWNPPFTLLLLLSTVTDFHCAAAIHQSRSSTGRRFWLLVSLGLNLGLLAIFKYGSFLLENWTLLLAQFGIDFTPLAPDIILPVGISFYTFQSLSYTLDVYRRQLKPWPSFLDFAMFVSFFPQLVAGPIVRAAEFLPQCVLPRRANPCQFSWGVTLLILGLVQKVILADLLLAPLSDRVFAAAFQAGWADAWIGTLAFSGQIFFDFNGYSTCAIGTALCLGFVLPDNFRAPYGAIGFRDFWQRWHISLSSWLRDYLYIPLGGRSSRRGRTLVNLMLTMLIGGLWHGAAWSFVFWGGLHGLYLLVEHLLSPSFQASALSRSSLVRSSLALLTYGLLCLTWVFFRAEGFSAAWQLLLAMVSFQPATLISAGEICQVLTLSLCLLAFHWYRRQRSFEEVFASFPWQGRALLIVLSLLALLVSSGDDRAFIYFQF